MLDRATLREDIASALDRLSDIQRSVLVAKVYDEMTFAAIAAEMNVAVSTVKTHYLRAVQAVRDRLRPRWADEVQP
jgi:RNA polymerase sigma factor (sigma-70 family)